MKWAGRLGLLRSEQGAVMVIVMMFCFIFLILGVAIYWLTIAQTRSTETERSDVKAFGVAEAGVDAGMLALKMSWPAGSSDTVTVDEALLKTSLQADNPSLWDPSRSPSSEFIDVAVYDNSAGGVTVTSPPVEAQRVSYDANGDGRMYVEATSNVDDDRHRILVLAERQKWDFNFPLGIALYSNTVDSNGTGYEIVIENGSPPVYYDVHDVLHKGIYPGGGVSTIPTSTDFEGVFTDALRRAIEGLAVSQGTYFTDDDEAEAFLTSGNADGSVVYIECDHAVDISGSMQMGTVDEPVVVVIDTPSGSDNVWDMRGSADFYGIVIVMGDSTLRGTSSIHGAMYVEGTLLNKGTGSTPEMNYHEEVIKNLNKQYVISVNIVPNSWEEYSVPVGTPTSVVSNP